MKRKRQRASRTPTIEPPGTLWTIGHSTHPIDELLKLLRAQEITQLADVRRYPGSRRYPRFNADELRHSLGHVGIDYAPFPDLGGRRTPLPDSPHSRWHNDSFQGYADYMDTAEFASAAERLAELARERRVVIMCAEAVWWRCHRSMIADAFKARGWTVLHIMGFGEPREHPYTPVARVEDGELTY